MDFAQSAYSIAKTLVLPPASLLIVAAVGLALMRRRPRSARAILIVAWVAQTFLQLVLLSIILVGQSVQSVASDMRSAKEFTDTETILDRLDVHTAGGIRDVLDAIQAIGNRP